MSVSLFAITNAKISGKETTEDWNNYLEKFKALNLAHAINYDGSIDDTKWNYWIDEKTEDTEFEVHYETPTPYAVTFYAKTGYISTIYRYQRLYEFVDLDWHQQFREDLWRILQIMGGTEVIFLGHLDKLYLYEEMVITGEDYETVKAKMISEFGAPVTDYHKLDYWSLNYDNITEFFLDDFADFKI